MFKLDLLAKLGERTQVPCATVGKSSQCRLALKCPHKHPGRFPVVKSALPQQIAVMCSENRQQQEQEQVSVCTKTLLGLDPVKVVCVL